ncbi:hypothetical protein BJF82_11750 [Kytococcus sp. CUA-901]|nr:hypothetical protein BJF82_11750 [Kytococcus sp. CUA-901]
MWRSPQATQYDDTASGTVAALIIFESALYEGTASAWQAQEMRYAAEALGLTPRALNQLGWRIVEEGEGGAVSRRRAARTPAAVNVRRAESHLPPRLAAGPVVEVFAPPEYDDIAPRWRALAALRVWRREVLTWAQETGWATEKRPAWEALALADTTHPVWGDEGKD